MFIVCKTTLVPQWESQHSYTTCSIFIILLFLHTQSYYLHVDNEKNNNSNIPVIVGVSVAAAAVLLLLVALLVILCCCFRPLICPFLGGDKVEEDGKCEPSHPGPQVHSICPHHYVCLGSNEVVSRNVTALEVRIPC